MPKLVRLSLGGSEQATILIEVPEELQQVGGATKVLDVLDQTFASLVHNEIVQNCKVLVGAFQQLKEQTEE